MTIPATTNVRPVSGSGLKPATTSEEKMRHLFAEKIAASDALKAIQNAPTPADPEERITYEMALYEANKRVNDAYLAISAARSK